MTKCVITGCKNKGLRPCSFMKSGWHSYDLFCDECHIMIEMMCIAIDSRAWRFSRIDQMINDLLIQAQNANWDINAILVHPI